jgi:DNA-binding SARP family transcriptional activator
MSEGIRLGAGVPSPRVVLGRPRLLDEILAEPCPVVLLAAPAGYGKTTTAAMAVRAAGANVLWLDCTDVDSSEALWAVVRAECTDRARREGAAAALLPRYGQDESAAQASAEAIAFLEEPGWVVVDSLSLEDGATSFTDLARFLRPLLRFGHRAVVTTRTCDIRGIGPEAAVVGAESLALGPGEVLELAAELGVALTDDEARDVHDTSRGQIALVLTLLSWARQWPLESVLSGEHGRDLAALLRGLVDSQLGGDGLVLFGAAALLREGSTAQLGRVCGGHISPELLERGAACVPLLRLEYADGIPCKFRLHDLGVAAFAGGCRSDEIDVAMLQSAVLELQRDGRLAEALRTVLKHQGPDQLRHVLEDWGDGVLAEGHAPLLAASLEALDPAAYLGRPSLLLLQARILRENGDPAGALDRASIARDLARADEDQGTLGQALATLARAHLDLAQYSEAKRHLDALVSSGGDATAHDLRILALSYLTVCSVVAGNLREARCYLDRAREETFKAPLDAEVEGRLAMACVCLDAAARGRYDKACETLESLVSRADLSASLRLQTLNNHAAALLEMGRLDRAAGVLAVAESECSATGPASLSAAIQGTFSELCGARGDYAEAVRRYDSLAEADGTPHADLLTLTASAPLWMRAVGEAERALRTAEECLGLLTRAPQPVTEWLAILEIAASLLALGDVRAAKRRATSVRRDAEAAQAAYHVLRADMILAEVARIEGDLPRAVEHLGQHREYILTESSNWQIGMYIRAFPSLLGVLATAIDPDELPLYLLKLVLPQDAEEALLAAREMMDPDTWWRLAARIVDEEEAQRLREGDGPHECRVRMFGGLSVKVGDRLVADRDWRKRKARLLFAMLVLGQGQDLPRDQVLEYLWPHMDDERARNNLYVVWSSMKSALSPDADKNTPCPYIDNSTGMLRSVPEHIDCDVEEFESLVAHAEGALLDGNEKSALAAYEKLYGVYRGELLPGDLYEDWFQSARDRYRQEFGDSMLKVAELLLSKGETARALKYVRKALDHDPWREDLYQLALKCQIDSGQRSAAVETFFACKDKLGDELGLDPSQETMRLYDQVLAMEESGEPDLTYG